MTKALVRLNKQMVCEPPEALPGNFCHRILGRKMRRLFNKYQRKMIRIISGNACASCGCKPNDLFHADHKVPLAKRAKQI